MFNILRLYFLIIMACTATANASASFFDCKDSGRGKHRPFYMQSLDGQTQYKDWSKTPKGLLGQNSMGSLDECQQALDAANNEFGVICSRTGLDGWKPTLYTGTLPGRADFGYLGGSSIMNFDHCLEATRHSSRKGVCFWGGSQWYVSPIDAAGLIMGPFSSIERCTDSTRQLIQE